MAIGMYLYWYRGLAEMLRYGRRVLYSIVLSALQTGSMLWDDSFLMSCHCLKYIGSLEGKKQMAHRRWKWHCLSLCLISLPFIQNLVDGGGKSPDGTLLHPHTLLLAHGNLTRLLQLLWQAIGRVKKKAFHHCWASQVIGLETFFFWG